MRMPGTICEKESVARVCLRQKGVGSGELLVDNREAVPVER